MRTKGLTNVLILWIAVSLLLLSQAKLSTADTELATSVTASSGGEASSGNVVMKSTLGQATPIGLSGSTNFQAEAGFWYQDPIPPSAIADLAINLSKSDIVLGWSHSADNIAIDYYIVYRSTQPYFEPTAGDSLARSKADSYTDPGAAGTIGTNYFYVVKAIDPRRNLAEDSNQVGEYDTGLTAAKP
jgi:hypothetical protein